MGSADGSTAQWVNESCQTLSAADFFVHPDMGSTRFGEATTVLQTVIGWSFEKSWPDDSQVQDELRPYLQKVLSIVMPSLVVAALLMLCIAWSQCPSLRAAHAATHRAWSPSRFPRAATCRVAAIFRALLCGLRSCACPQLPPNGRVELVKWTRHGVVRPQPDGALGRPGTWWDATATHRL